MQPTPAIDPQEQWWKEDAARLNELGNHFRKNGLTIGLGAKPLTLNPDGSEKDEAGDAAGLDMAKRLREEHPEAADAIIASALKKNGAKPKA